MNNRELFLLIAGILFLCLALTAAVGSDIAKWGYACISLFCFWTTFISMLAGLGFAIASICMYAERTGRESSQ